MGLAKAMGSHFHSDKKKKNVVRWDTIRSPFLLLRLVPWSRSLGNVALPLPHRKTFIVALWRKMLRHCCSPDVEFR